MLNNFPNKDMASKMPNRNLLNNMNNMRGFNKTPGQLGEQIFNQTHQPIKFHDPNAELKSYYERNVKDPSKELKEMKRFKGFN